MTVAHTEEGERTVSQSPTGNRAAATERAILAGGCFWGMEDLLRRARGVISTRVGYTGGEMPDPTYARHYGHAEAVEVTFDPSVLAYRSLLELFFQIHDPTTYEQQGSDVGPSYRSAIFYTTEVQKEPASRIDAGSRLVGDGANRRHGLRPHLSRRCAMAGMRARVRAGPPRQPRPARSCALWGAHNCGPRCERRGDSVRPTASSARPHPGSGSPWQKLCRRAEGVPSQLTQSEPMV